MKELKKKGHNINLKGIVIHQVIKDAGIRSASVKYAKGTLAIGDKEKAFISKIYKSYFESSNPIYGIFEEQNPTFKNSLSNYLKNGELLSFSKEATELYKKTLEPSTPATGGFLIFSHFENLDKNFDYMLVMTITNKNGFVVSETDLSLLDIKNLDLSKIDVACMINITKWQEIKSGSDSESMTYLSFAKGAKNVSVYFLTFIDCDNKTTKTESTNRFIKAFESYCKEKGYEREEKIRIRNQVYNYCIECIDSKKEISLSSLSAILDPNNITEFEKFASDELYGVSSIINAEKSKLKTVKFVTYKDKDMTVEFDAGLLNEGSIFYDRNKNNLTFKNIPRKLADQIPE